MFGDGLWSPGFAFGLTIIVAMYRIPYMSSSNQTIGTSIRQLRIAKGMSQEVLAATAGSWVGSALSYWVALKLGRPLIEK